MTNSFIFRAGDCRPLSSEEFGRCAALWAFNMAKDEREDLEKRQYMVFRQIFHIKNNPIPFLLHTCAIFTSAYVAYSVCVLQNVPATEVTKIQSGIRRGVIEWMSLLNLHTDEVKDIFAEFYGIYGTYLEANIDDCVHRFCVDTRADYAGLGKTESIFRQFVEENYWDNKKPDDSEIQFIKFFKIGERVLGLYTALRDELDIVFVE